MSAFVVSEQTMHRAVTAIRKTGEHSLVANAFGIDGRDYDALGRVLYSLNIEAVQQRYPDTLDRPDNMPGEEGCSTYPLTYRFAPAVMASRPALYKALECLIYQCREGSVLETAQFRALERIRAELAAQIINDMPEYQAAQWDA